MNAAPLKAGTPTLMRGALGLIERISRRIIYRGPPPSARAT
jgi:hypothetical protein